MKLVEVRNQAGQIDLYITLHAAISHTDRNTCDIPPFTNGPTSRLMVP
jgi:hypothetical protein